MWRFSLNQATLILGNFMGGSGKDRFEIFIRISTSEYSPDNSDQIKSL